jgi:hypothetical protein
MFKFHQVLHHSFIWNGSNNIDLGYIWNTRYKNTKSTDAYFNNDDDDDDDDNNNNNNRKPYLPSTYTGVMEHEFS